MTLEPAAAPWRLRAPAPTMAGLGLLIVFSVGTALVYGVLVALQGQNHTFIAGFITPAAIAAGLTGLEARHALKKQRIVSLRSAALRGARAWGAVGAAWPLAWGSIGLTMGDWVTFQAHLLPAAIGLVAGAAIGALAAMAAAFAVMKRP